MLTTIFSGHTFDLADLVAIGPLMMEHKGVQGSIYTRTLYVSLFLKHSVVLRYDHFQQEIIYQPEGDQSHEWANNRRALRKLLDEIIPEWEKARQEAHQKPITFTLDPRKAMKSLEEIKSSL